MEPQNLRTTNDPISLPPHASLLENVVRCQAKKRRASHFRRTQDSASNRGASTSSQTVARSEAGLTRARGRLWGLRPNTGPRRKYLSTKNDESDARQLRHGSLSLSVAERKLFGTRKAPRCPRDLAGHEFCRFGERSAENFANTPRRQRP